MVDVKHAEGPIRIRVSCNENVAVSVAEAPLGIRVLGTPGPDGQKGDKGDPGRDGIAALPEDTTINGGFF